MVDDERTGDDLRGQGNDDQFAEQGHWQTNPFSSKTLLEQAKDTSPKLSAQVDIELLEGFF